MRRGNFFRRNQYKIAAVCVLAAVLGLAGMYMLRGRETKENGQQSAAEKSEKSQNQTVAKAEKKEETKQTAQKPEKKAEAKTEEKDTEQTARVSAVVKPKQAEVKKDTQTDATESGGTKQGAQSAGGAGQAEQTGQAGQEGQDNPEGQKEQKKQKKTAETGKTETETFAELHFDTANGLLWPVDGAIILDYSMDQTVYFTTLDQYKYNPAVIISGNVNDKVKAAANGKITDISANEVTGCTVTMDIGDGYTAIYGQLKEVPYKKGAYLKAGDSIGFISEPTKYYSLEGSNLYFALEKDGVPVDPVEFFAIQSEE